MTIIEPGAFRTDWAGSSMKVGDIRPEYLSSVGYLADHIRASNGQQPGDPEKAARTIIDLTNNPNPPVHLLLGSDAFDLAQANARALAASDEQWRKVSLSTDFDDDLAASSRKWDR